MKAAQSIAAAGAVAIGGASVLAKKAAAVFDEADLVRLAAGKKRRTHG